MDDLHLGAVEARFADLIWKYEPLSSRALVALCGEELGWKKSTTYTVIKRLAERGVVHTENAVVTALVRREDVQRAESRAFIAHNFHGSLPAFLTAFMGNSKLSKEDADVLHAMIDRFEQENSGRN